MSISIAISSVSPTKSLSVTIYIISVCIYPDIIYIYIYYLALLKEIYCPGFMTIFFISDKRKGIF